MRTWCTALLLTTILVGTPAIGAEADKVSRRDLFELWAACAPVSLMVGDLSKEGTRIGLRKADIRIAVRSRLRAARLYVDRNAAPVLAVTVQVHKGVAGIDLEFRKIVADISAWSSWPKGFARLSGRIATWETGALGMHGGKPDLILSAIERATDSFIDEYLRVNERAC